MCVYYSARVFLLLSLLSGFPIAISNRMNVGKLSGSFTHSSWPLSGAGNVAAVRYTVTCNTNNALPQNEKSVSGQEQDGL